MKGCVNSVEKLAGNIIEDGGSQITEQISGGKSQSQESYDQATHGENYEKYDYNIDPASMVEKYYSYVDNKFENKIPETIPEKSSAGLGSHEFPWEIFHKSQEQIPESNSYESTLAPTYEPSYEPSYEPAHEPTYGEHIVHEEASEKTPKDDGYDKDEQITEQYFGGKSKSPNINEPSYASIYEPSYESTSKPTHKPTYESTSIHEKTSEKTPKDDGYDKDEYIISDKNSSAVSNINSVEQIHGENIPEKSLDQNTTEETSDKTPKNDGYDNDEFIISDKNSSAVSVINSVEQIDGEEISEKSLEQTSIEEKSKKTPKNDGYDNDEFINQQAADSAFPDINEAPESYSVESEEDYSPEKMGNNGFYPDDNDLEELIQEDGDDDDPNDSHVNNNSVGDHADVQDDSHGGDSDVEFYV